MAPPVELRLLDLDRAPADASALPLAERERARALAEPARRRFLAGRTALRRLLAVRLALPPEAVPIVLGPFGKPLLAGERPPLAFSLARSGRFGLLAIGPVATLGVDLERVRPLDDPEALAAFLLDPIERRALSVLPPAARNRALLRAWVREEAHRKAEGTGLRDERAMRGRHGRPGSFALLDLEPGPGLVAALAAPRPAGEVHGFYGSRALAAA